MLQTIPANKVDFRNHNIEEQKEETVRVATKFTFPGKETQILRF